VNRKLLKIAVPNAISLASMGCGLASVTMAAVGRFEAAAWLIIYSCFLDKADGAAARALDAGSDFGVQMDSFSDFTAFGIAPAALMWFLGPAVGLPEGWSGFAAASFPFTASIRLARFNVAGHEDKEFFTGVPTTFAAGLLAATVLTFRDLALLPAWANALPPVMILLAVLMVSPIRIPKLKGRDNRALNAIQIAAALAGLVVTVLRTLPEVLLALGLGYLVIGIAAGARSPSPGPQPTDPPGN